MSALGGVLERLRRPSLARRLVILAVGWSFAALVISAVVLALLFQQAALRRFDAQLSDLIDNLISGSTVEGGEVLAPALTDLRALRAYSGRYWAITEPKPGGGVRTVVPSRSLWDSELTVPADLPSRLRAEPSKPIAFDGPGPQAGERLRLVARWTTIPGREAPLIFIAAENSGPIDREVRNFVTATALFFALLSGGLIVAAVVQVRVGLAPLFRLSGEVAEVRRGKAERLRGIIATDE